MTKVGAVTYEQCPYGGGTGNRTRCRCGKCQVCGYHKHTAIHGPRYGHEAGSEPFDHEFKAEES